MWREESAGTEIDLTDGDAIFDCEDGPGKGVAEDDGAGVVRVGDGTEVEDKVVIGQRVVGCELRDGGAERGGEAGINGLVDGGGDGEKKGKEDS